MLSCFIFAKNAGADTHTHTRYDKIKFKEFNINLDIIFQNCFSLFNQVTNNTLSRFTYTEKINNIRFDSRKKV